MFRKFQKASISVSPSIDPHHLTSTIRRIWSRAQYHLRPPMSPTSAEPTKHKSSHLSLTVMRTLLHQISRKPRVQNKAPRSFAAKLHAPRCVGTLTTKHSTLLANSETKDLESKPRITLTEYEKTDRGSERPWFHSIPFLCPSHSQPFHSYSIHRTPIPFSFHSPPVQSSQRASNYLTPSLSSV